MKWIFPWMIAAVLSACSNTAPVPEVDQNKVCKQTYTDQATCEADVLCVWKTKDDGSTVCKAKK